MNGIAGAVSARLHHGGPQGAKPKAEAFTQSASYLPPFSSLSRRVNCGPIRASCFR